MGDKVIHMWISVDNLAQKMWITPAFPQVIQLEQALSKENLRFLHKKDIHTGICFTLLAEKGENKGIKQGEVPDFPKTFQEIHKLSTPAVWITSRNGDNFYVLGISGDRILCFVNRTKCQARCCRKNTGCAGARGM